MIIVIDTETTHYKPELAHVIEIGAITDTGESFESLCNPGIDLRGCEAALKINGIKEEEVLGAPTVEEVSIDFWEWLYSFQAHDVKLAGYNSNSYDGPILARHP